jgi:hypothetical protein
LSLISEQDLGRIRYIALFVCLLLDVINMYWFSKIVRGLKKLFSIHLAQAKVQGQTVIGRGHTVIGQGQVTSDKTGLCFKSNGNPRLNGSPSRKPRRHEDEIQREERNAGDAVEGVSGGVSGEMNSGVSDVNDGGHAGRHVISQNGNSERQEPFDKEEEDDFPDYVGAKAAKVRHRGKGRVEIKDVEMLIQN